MLTEPSPLTMRLSLPLTLLLLGAWAIPGGSEDRAPLTATAPQLDDEEKYSAHMPAHLRCDACRAVAYQMWQHLAKAEAKLHTPDSGGRQWELSESVYIDVLDKSCSQSWQGLSMTCFHYLGEFGEDQIYEAHQQGQGALEALLCGGLQGACSEEAPVTRTEL
ncbi:marginal zone B- and B1-cell-specific protein isoform X2 [Canis lupus baileyi]|uniref:marginal zone B- and B1-cell-specific protein isoform X2 n=1 Tax=Canis lupus dingo TaxID=286419 RepID=UPI0015F1441C|nr:marginal zone B- and B1-cell-specific protein isoform X2 [Canis lupus dingo]XP_038313688.1 marginal zone B- and B1-cell-specific protein isoform X2 [Canis lupus familiaris]XP_038386198.1 marginal zone B- and B1-cell-specific protein isoform X2 [Canis lupus familiaris]XP_038514490.1 marginal zone B- and B1-cell-specific protein isoform X2 [Canis lupus familiaris]